MKVEIDPNTLKLALRKSWSKETCYPSLRKEWSSKNPALGQCAVTALIVQDFLGGDLLYCKHKNHYWNRLPNGKEIDFTRDQFSENVIICLDEIRTRKHVLESEHARKVRTKERYLILKQRIENFFAKRSKY